MKKAIISICIILVFLSCEIEAESQEDLFEGINPFIGTWVSEDNNEMWIFSDIDFKMYENKQLPNVYWDLFYGTYDILEEGIIVNYEEPSFAFGPIGAFFENNKLTFVTSGRKLSKISKLELIPKPLWEDLFEEDLFKWDNPFIGTWEAQYPDNNFWYIFTDDKIQTFWKSTRTTNDPFNPWETGWTPNRKGTYTYDDNVIDMELYTSWDIENSNPPKLYTVIYNEKTKKSFVSWDYNFPTGTIRKRSNSTEIPQPLFSD